MCKSFFFGSERNVNISEFFERLRLSRLKKTDLSSSTNRNEPNIPIVFLSSEKCLRSARVAVSCQWIGYLKNAERICWSRHWRELETRWSSERTSLRPFEGFLRRANILSRCSIKQKLKNVWKEERLLFPTTSRLDENEREGKSLEAPSFVVFSPARRKLSIRWARGRVWRENSSII